MDPRTARLFPNWWRTRVLRILAVSMLVAAGITITAAPAAAAGGISVSPTTGLVDLQQVTITGTGWIPGHQIGFCQGVQTSTPGAENCSGGTGTLVTANDGGAFTATLRLTRLINVPSTGQVDCAAAAATCVVGAADFDNIQATAVFQPLSFAPVPPIILPGFSSVPEGDSGTTSLVIPVDLSFPSAATVTANWMAYDSGGCDADPATDYGPPVSGVVTFAPGNTSDPITINVVGDTLEEPDECVNVLLSNPVNATFREGVAPVGVGMILNDDEPLTILPGLASATEGNAGTIELHVPLTLNQTSADTVTVDWVTFVNANGPPSCQADPATDYTATSGTVTFAPGDTDEAVTISVNGDTTVEPDECVIVSFRNATNARIGGFFGLGVGTITNDDVPPTILPGMASVIEGNTGTTALQVPVSLSKAWPDAITVNWVTFVNANGPPACQADPATDYAPASGTVTFLPGDTEESVTVTVNGDTTVEPDECVIVSLRNATNARVGGFFGLGVGTITSDD